jgi:hypothetical protein
VSLFVVEVVVKKKGLNILVGLSAAVVVCASGTAHAARVGVFIGGGGYYYPWGPVPYYYYPPPVVAVPAPVPQEYVEQGRPDAGPSQSGGTWYYCDASKTYYPYVKECGSGWRAVPAQPPEPAN